MKRTLSRFVGVDQTGAARRGGLAAAPLPCVALQREGRWLLVPGARGGVLARAFSPSFVDTDGATAVLVDAVLGLPAADARAAGLPLGEQLLPSLLDRATSFRGPAGRRYGREVGAAFYAGLRGPGDGLREVDRRVGASSVFTTVPWQRNVQTGTWRVLRELAASPGWLAVWPFTSPDARGARGWLLEAWPTLAWRLLGSDRRRPDRLGAFAEVHGVSVHPEVGRAVARSPDVADAAVLALLGGLLAAAGDLVEPVGAGPAADEGWIAGVPLTEGGGASLGPLV